MASYKSFTIASVDSFDNAGTWKGTYKIAFHADGRNNPFTLSFQWTAKDGETLPDGYILNARHKKTVARYADYKSCLYHILQAL